MTSGKLRRALRDHGVDRTALVVLLCATVVYGIGATWGLPYASNPIQSRGWDVDGVSGIRVLSELHNLLVEPKSDWYVAYPLLHYIVLAALYAPYLGYLLTTGELASPGPVYPYGFADPVAALAFMDLIARIVTVTMAAGTVAITHALGSLLWGRRGGIAAAVLVGLSGPMVYYARTSNLDVPVLFWTALGLLVVVRTLRDGLTTGRAAAIGLLAALSVGTKDQAYGAWVPVVLLVLWAHFRAVRERSPDAAPSRPWAVPLSLIGTGLVTFAVCHGIPIRPSRFTRHLDYLTSFEENFPNVLHENGLTLVRDASPSGYAALLGDVFTATAAGMTLVLAALGVLAAVWAWREQPQARPLVLAAGGFVLLTLFPLHHMQYRYTLLPIFLLSLFLAGALVSRSVPRAVRLGLTAVAAVIVSWQLVRAVDVTYQMLSDARYAAGDWLASELQAGDSVGYFGAMHQLPHIPAGVHVVPLTETGEVDLVLPSDWPSYLVVAPDYYADEKRERSTLLPDELYGRLLDGSLGYQRVAVFRTEPLTGRPIPYLPYVNPQVQIFQRRSSA